MLPLRLRLIMPTYILHWDGWHIMQEDPKILVGVSVTFHIQTNSVALPHKEGIHFPTNGTISNQCTLWIASMFHSWLVLSEKQNNLYCSQIDIFLVHKNSLNDKKKLLIWLCVCLIQNNNIITDFFKEMSDSWYSIKEIACHTKTKHNHTQSYHKHTVSHSYFLHQINYIVP